MNIVRSQLSHKKTSWMIYGKHLILRSKQCVMTQNQGYFKVIVENISVETYDIDGILEIHIRHEDH